jgi:Protein of unknown function (DUF2809)
VAAIFYEILWILVGAFLYPKANRKPIAVWIFLGTRGIEFLKLYQPPWLQAIRVTVVLPSAVLVGLDWLGRSPHLASMLLFLADEKLLSDSVFIGSSNYFELL